MRFVATPIAGVHVVELERHEDERGFFARTWCREELAAAGLNSELSQCSLSRNVAVGTLRGMHLQRAPHRGGEARPLHARRDLRRRRRPSSGIVDARTVVRSCSSTPSPGGALYIPEGCAHGFQTLLPDTDVFYAISAPYAPEAASGVRWDDPFFGIAWPEAAEAYRQRP